MVTTDGLITDYQNYNPKYRRTTTDNALEALEVGGSVHYGSANKQL